MLLSKSEPLQTWKMQRIKKSFESKAKAKPPGLNDADLEEILDTAGHIPDRDQEFSVIDTTESGERWIGGTQEDLMTGVEDEDEGDTGIVSDPAYDRDGAERILRSAPSAAAPMAPRRVLPMLPIPQR